MMNDKLYKKLVKTIDTKAVPPEGLKEKLLVRVMQQEYETKPALTSFERFIFEKPLRTACVISIPVSASLWVALGSDFAKLFSGIIG